MVNVNILRTGYYVINIFGSYFNSLIRLKNIGNMERSIFAFLEVQHPEYLLSIFTKLVVFFKESKLTTEVGSLPIQDGLLTLATFP